MGSQTNIEWAHRTFNGWIGCTKVSPACDGCYAEAWSKRYGRAVWGPGQTRQRTSAKNWNEPKKWNRQAEKSGDTCRVFCSSLSDVFDTEVPEVWRADLFRLISETPHLTWMILTKRPKVARDRFGDLSWWRDVLGSGQAEKRHGLLSKLWIGTTVENQDMANLRIPILLEVPAAVHFLSCEPLLGPVNLHDVIHPSFKQKHQNDPYVAYDVLRGHIKGPDDIGLPTVDWVIAGGESGPDARPMHQEWVVSLRDQCQATSVPFFFKQWGEWHPMGQTLADGRLNAMDCQRPNRWHEESMSTRVGKKKAGGLLDGTLIQEFP